MQQTFLVLSFSLESLRQVAGVKRRFRYTGKILHLQRGINDTFLDPSEELVSRHRHRVRLCATGDIGHY